ncbi:MAG: SOS response-associated peptidase [Euryarchaeota archaeon]|nr:SOS response-associated peptidase [Euryarchaeota archaeon]
MCGRFSLGLVYGFSTRFGVPEDPSIKPRYNIAPFQQVPVIVGGGSKSIRRMRWGLVPHWAKGEEFGLKLINVRSESALEKPMFKPLLNRQRCLVPATGFYEWQRQGSRRRPFHVRVRGQEFFAMAGIYDTWSREGKELITFSILTTAANDTLAPIHDRMPVILRQEREGEWVSTEVLSADSMSEIFEPLPSSCIDAYPVSDMVNDSRSDHPDMVLPHRVQQTTLF